LAICKKANLQYEDKDSLISLVFDYEWFRGGLMPYVSFCDVPHEDLKPNTILSFEEWPIFIDFEDGGKIKHDLYEDKVITTIAKDSDAFMEVMLILATMHSLKLQCALEDVSPYIEQIIAASGVPESRHFYETNLFDFWIGSNCFSAHLGENTKMECAALKPLGQGHKQA
jgi:hypothetical protein